MDFNVDIKKVGETLTVVRSSLREVMQFYNMYGDERGGNRRGASSGSLVPPIPRRLAKLARSWRLRLVEVTILVQHCFCGGEIWSKTP